MKPVLLLVALVAVARANPPALFDGLGPHHRAVTTTNKDAQRYFDQGLAFLFAFNHDEAIRAFSAAAEIDPDCAMAYWGVALANGPHINNPTMDEPHQKAAWDALTRARAAKNSSAVERALIMALDHRYANTFENTGKPVENNRAPLDKAYADSMRVAWTAHPRDADVGALFAESLMDLRPWDLWTAEGKPQPETPEILTTLERVMELDALHPLANHLYVHALESSPHPERADDAADRLRTLAPALGHLLHMPSHIDVRRGRWEKAERANLAAIEADRLYQIRAPEQGFYRLYMLHNRHMLTWAAIMRGQSALAESTIADAMASMPPDWVRQNAAAVDGFMAMPLEVQMRFGRWQQILAAPDFPAYLPIARALRHAARGVALAAKKDLAQAKVEARAFVAAQKKVAADAVYGNNSAAALLLVAERLLDGEIAIQAGRGDDAIAKLRAATEAEDALRYDEPPDWIQPTRHALGAALLKLGRASEAEAVYRDDLVRLPENGWSLWGLMRALELQKKPADDVTARFTKTWAEADTKLSSSCLCLPGP